MTLGMTMGFQSLTSDKLATPSLFLHKLWKNHKAIKLPIDFAQTLQYVPLTTWQASCHNCGAIAQLGERVNGIHEVSGSIPLSSTIFP